VGPEARFPLGDLVAGRAAGRALRAGGRGGPCGGITRRPAPLHDPVYFIALCAASAADLPEPGAGLSLFDDAGETVYAHYHHEIRKNMAAGEILAERERELAAPARTRAGAGA
jgi:hypothetical protein